jgi:predicted nucleic acid-binding protein
MSRYLLDSDILSYLQQKDSPFYPAVSERLSRLSDDDEVIISILSLYEIAYGISWAPEEDREYLLKSVASVEATFRASPLSRRGAGIFGELKSAYRQNTGAPSKILKRDDIDLLIASSAIAEDAVLVSNDRIFAAIAEIEPALQLENWAA